MIKKSILASACFLGLAGSASAVTQTFDDESAWRSAVGGVYRFVDFDSVSAGTEVFTLPTLGLSLDPLNDGTQPTIQPYSLTGGFVRSGPNNILNDADFTLPGRGPITVRPINSSDRLFGFGLWNVGGDDTLSLTFLDSSGEIIASVVSASAFGFFGIVNDSGAASAVIDFVGGNGYAPTDDWQTATRETFDPDPDPNVVPLPASLPMIFCAMLGLFGLSRRKPQAVSA